MKIRVWPASGGPREWECHDFETRPSGELVVTEMATVTDKQPVKTMRDGKVGMECRTRMKKSILALYPITNWTLVEVIER